MPLRTGSARAAERRSALCRPSLERGDEGEEQPAHRGRDAELDAPAHDIPVEVGDLGRAPARQILRGRGALAGHRAGERFDLGEGVGREVDPLGARHGPALGDDIGEHPGRSGHAVPQQAPESDKLAKAAAAATGDARAAAYQAFQKQGNIDGPFIPLIQPAQIVVTSNTLNNVVVNPVTTLEFATIS